MPHPRLLAIGLVAACLFPFGIKAQPIAAHQVCVENASATTHVFAVEAGSPETRKLADLAPNARLCTDAAMPGARGVVSVYESRDTFEGCSRLVSAGIPEALIAYAEFDRCRWSSHEN